MQNTSDKMTLKEAEIYLNTCIARGWFEKGAFDDFTMVEKIIFATHTKEREKDEMFKNE